MIEQRNLFTTKHFWSIISLYFISTLQPAIDASIDGKLTGKDVGHLVTATIATIVGAGLKLTEDNIYTPKGIIGRDKENQQSMPIVNTSNDNQTTETIDLQAGINLIKKFEGCCLEAYPDPLTGGEPITIGWGNTCKKDGSYWFLGDSITQDEADCLLLETINSRFVPSLQKIPTWSEMNNNQKGAILSFAWNLGADFYNTAGFATITNSLSETKYFDNVPNALMLYVNPNTNVTEGLKRRRKAEGLLWSTTL